MDFIKEVLNKLSSITLEVLKSNNSLTTKDRFAKTLRKVSNIEEYIHTDLHLEANKQDELVAEAENIIRRELDTLEDVIRCDNATDNAKYDALCRVTQALSVYKQLL